MFGFSRVPLLTSTVPKPTSPVIRIALISTVIPKLRPRTSTVSRLNRWLAKSPTSILRVAPPKIATVMLSGNSMLRPTLAVTTRVKLEASTSRPFSMAPGLNSITSSEILNCNICRSKPIASPAFRPIKNPSSKTNSKSDRMPKLPAISLILFNQAKAPSKRAVTSPNSTRFSPSPAVKSNEVSSAVITINPPKSTLTKPTRRANMLAVS